MYSVPYQPTVRGCTRWHLSAEQTSPESETGPRSSLQPSTNVSYRPGHLPMINTQQHIVDVCSSPTKGEASQTTSTYVCQKGLEMEVSHCVR